MKKIKLTRGYEALVDDEDFEKFGHLKWHAHTKGSKRSPKVYAARSSNVTLHRMVLGLLCAPRNVHVDHINGDTLDNQKCNLRICTNSQNQANRGVPINNTSGFKGVTFENNRWRAAVETKEKKISLGSYTSKEDAARAYNQGAIKYFGQFAFLNKGV